MSNKNLLKNAKLNKKDEFYTQLADIEKEFVNYRTQFKGKVVYCNADDPFESNFFKYLASNFNFLGLKKLIATSYAGSPITGRQLSLFDMEGIKSKKKKEPIKISIEEVVTSPCNNKGISCIAMASSTSSSFEISVTPASELVVAPAG